MNDGVSYININARGKIAFETNELNLGKREYQEVSLLKQVAGHELLHKVVSLAKKGLLSESAFKKLGELERSYLRINI